MNKSLYDGFNGLNDFEKGRLKGTLKSSPTAQRLIIFLEKCKTSDFNNMEVVSFVYKDDLKNVDFLILQNRYFKLRKKIIEEHLQEKKEKQIFTTTEEITFLNAVTLFKKNPKEAHKNLIELQNHLWENNIFELLPKVIDQIIYSHQLLKMFDSIDPFYVKYNKAVQLQNYWYEVLSRIRKIYDITYSKGFSYVQKELDFIKRVATRNKEYPRFNLAYNFVSLYYKLGSKEYLEQPNITSRHFSTILAITKKRAAIPITLFAPNYLESQNLRFNEITVRYHFNRCEFIEAYTAMKEVWNKKNVTSPSHYINMTRMCISCGKFKEGLKIANDFLKFNENNKHEDNKFIPYFLLAGLYTNSYHELKFNQKDVQDYMTKMDLFLSQLQKEQNVGTAVDVLSIQFQHAYIEKNHAKALQILNQADFKDYCKKSNIYDYLKEFIDHLLKDNDNALKIKALKTKLNKLLLKTKEPGIYIYINWMIQMLQAEKKPRASKR